MSLFDKKNFNGEVFAAYVASVLNLNRNELLKSGAVVEKPQYAAMLPDQTGGNYITVPIKARISGQPDNYDGSTDINSDSRTTYTHGRIVVGRAHGWTERDFASDVTGEDFMPAAVEVAEFWDDVDQATILATMRGIFSMTGAENLAFVNGHTLDISANAADNKCGETTLNNTMQKALGDNKAKFALAIMHSQVSTNLENLKLLEYMKYTDKDGVERNLALATWNGRVVLVDDGMPVEHVNAQYAKTTDAALVEGKTYYTRSGNASNYVYTAVDSPEVANIGTYYEATDGYDVYTTYVFGNGAIEYTNCGVKVPFEMDRNPFKNGGEDTIYSRQRKVFSPYGISFKNTGILSPTDAQLADGANWELANSNEDGQAKYFPAKAIPIARIISRG